MGKVHTGKTMEEVVRSLIQEMDDDGILSPTPNFPRRAKKHNKAGTVKLSAALTSLEKLYVKRDLLVKQIFDVEKKIAAELKKDSKACQEDHNQRSIMNKTFDLKDSKKAFDLFFSNIRPENSAKWDAFLGITNGKIDDSSPEEKDTEQTSDPATVSRPNGIPAVSGPAGISEAKERPSDD